MESNYCVPFNTITKNFPSFAQWRFEPTSSARWGIQSVDLKEAQRSKPKLRGGRSVYLECGSGILWGQRLEKEKGGTSGNLVNTFVFVVKSFCVVEWSTTMSNLSRSLAVLQLEKLLLPLQVCHQWCSSRYITDPARDRDSVGDRLIWINFTQILVSR